MTTPRDDIGLSERLRNRTSLQAFVQLTFRHSYDYEAGRALLDEAATQLDAQAAELERVERNRDMWKGQSERQAKALTELREEAAELVVCQYALSAAEARATRAEQERDVAKVVERESFQKYVDANEARIDALRDRDEAVALLVRVNTLAQMPAWRRMPDGASFSTTPLAGDINTTIRRLAGTEKEGK